VDSLEIREAEGELCFEVRVAPRASRTAIVGVHAGALKIRLTAAPVDGAANEALIKLLSKEFAVPRSAVSIVHGHHSRTKTVRVQGIAAGDLRERTSAGEQ